MRHWPLAVTCDALSLSDIAMFFAKSLMEFSLRPEHALAGCRSVLFLTGDTQVHQVRLRVPNWGRTEVLMFFEVARTEVLGFHSQVR